MVSLALSASTFRQLAIPRQRPRSPRGLLESASPSGNPFARTAAGSDQEVPDSIPIVHRFGSRQRKDILSPEASDFFGGDHGDGGRSPDHKRIQCRHHLTQNKAAQSESSQEKDLQQQDPEKCRFPNAIRISRHDNRYQILSDR
jgi:hypothetical protein